MHRLHSTGAKNFASSYLRHVAHPDTLSSSVTAPGQYEWAEYCVVYQEMCKMELARRLLTRSIREGSRHRGAATGRCDMAPIGCRWRGSNLKSSPMTTSPLKKQQRSSKPCFRCLHARVFYKLKLFRSSLMPGSIKCHLYER